MQQMCFMPLLSGEFGLFAAVLPTIQGMKPIQYTRAQALPDLLRQRIAAAGHVLDDGLLRASELEIAKDFPKDGVADRLAQGGVQVSASPRARAGRAPRCNKCVSCHYCLVNLGSLRPRFLQYKA